MLIFLGTNYEVFTAACAKLKEKIESVVPQGNRRARIRATNRESRFPKAGELGDTIGDEVFGHGCRGRRRASSEVRLLDGPRIDRDEAELSSGN